ncbi:T9SS type A sorting domain-containing protein, partial [bacterium]|nr:T9SS type A sorting domain-containing protein [bacterium]
YDLDENNQEENAFAVYDVTDPENPELTYTYFRTPAYQFSFVDVQVSSRIVSVGFGDFCIRIFDATDPVNVEECGCFTGVRPMENYIPVDSYLIQATSNRFRMIDITAAQNHYYSIPNPTGWGHDFTVTDITHNGQPLEIGNSFAIFDGAFCVGTNSYMNGYPVPLLAYALSPWFELPGFTNGNEFYFHVWSEEDQAEFIAQATIANGEEVFDDHGITELSLETVEGPVLSLPYNPVDFGEVQTTSTVEHSIILKNTGLPDLHIIEIASSDENFDINLTEITLAYGESTTLTISFTPLQAIPYQESISIECDVPLHPNFTISVSGQGIGEEGVGMELPLQANYFELVSTFVEPLDLDAASVFDIDHLSIVYDHAGGILLPPEINTIGDIQVNRGYKIFANETTSLEIYGQLIDPETLYTTSGGTWSWIGYPFNHPQSIEISFATINYDDDIQIVLTDDGRIWVPSLGINTVGNQLPGEGYQIFTLSNENFIYSEAPNVARNNNQDGEYSNLPSYDAIDAPKPTGLPYAILVAITDHLRELNPAIIEVYDGDLLVGKSLVSDDEYTPVIAWEGSPEHDLAGFTKGNPISVKVLDATGNLLSSYDHSESPSFSGYDFGEGPYAKFTLESVQSDQSNLPTEFTVGNAYPNPFNATLTVPFSLPETGEVTISIFNTLGQEIFNTGNTFSAGSHRFIFEGSDAGSGLYFVKVNFGQNSFTQKIILLR